MSINQRLESGLEKLIKNAGCALIVRVQPTVVYRRFYVWVI